jgi:cytochrome oxidase assembly protein ShyY1
VLKTALKPKWIGTLLGALLLATAFVWLSQWQFGQSKQVTGDSSGVTEQAVPLTEHFQPGRDMYVADADQIVTATGHFVQDTSFLISGRLQNGEEGYWVAAAFEPDGAPGKNVIPVVRGWQKAAAEPAALPTGEVSLKGRLLPSESPTGTRVNASGTFSELSAAWMANIWDRESYDGFIVAFEATSGGNDVGAASAGLEQIWVGPQPTETTVNWLNIFYGVEWVVFAGFAFFIWWRLVKDDYQRDEEYELELAAWRQRQAAREAQAAQAAAAGGTGEAGPGDPAAEPSAAHDGDPAPSGTQN